MAVFSGVHTLTMRTLAILFLSLILGQHCSPLCSLEESSEEDGGFMPQADGSMKWMSASKTHLLLRSVLRTFTPVDDVNFYLHTRANPKIAQELFIDDIESVKASLFDWRNPTRILVHGWMSNSELEVNTLIRDAYLSIGPHNIIVVNWITKSVGLYTTAVLSVPTVGETLAAFIDFMAKHRYIEPGNLTIVGHSLGAHICGVAGRTIKSGQIHTIIGLDPASSLFPYQTSAERLRPSDAYYVESIQTNGLMSGYVRPIGKCTFYPNGGQMQPGCGLDIGGGCAHFRSYRFFAEAIRTNGFPSIQCCNYKKAVTKKCGKTFSLTVRMGAPSNAELETCGAYYVPTRPYPPYAVKPDK